MSIDAAAVHHPHRPGGLCCPDAELWAFDPDGVPLRRELSLSVAVMWHEAYEELEPHLWAPVGHLGGVPGATSPKAAAT